MHNPYRVNVGDFIDLCDNHRMFETELGRRVVVMVDSTGIRYKILGGAPYNPISWDEIVRYVHTGAIRIRHGYPTRVALPPGT